MIRLVTLFSGIRAIVLSHHRMEEEHVNVYACNNEEIDHIIAFEKETPNRPIQHQRSSQRNQLLPPRQNHR